MTLNTVIFFSENCVIKHSSKTISSGGELRKKNQKKNQEKIKKKSW